MKFFNIKVEIFPEHDHQILVLQNSEKNLKLVHENINNRHQTVVFESKKTLTGGIKLWLKYYKGNIALRLVATVIFLLGSIVSVNHLINKGKNHQFKKYHTAISDGINSTFPNIKSLDDANNFGTMASISLMPTAPNSAEKLILDGRGMLQGKRYSEAAEIFLEVSDMGLEARYYSLWYLALCHLGQEDFLKARETLMEIVDKETMLYSEAKKALRDLEQALYQESL